MEQGWIGRDRGKDYFMANVGISTHWLWNGVGSNECLWKIFEISEMKAYTLFLKELCLFSLICLIEIGNGGPWNTSCTSKMHYTPLCPHHLTQFPLCLMEQYKCLFSLMEVGVWHDFASWVWFSSFKQTLLVPFVFIRYAVMSCHAYLCGEL